MKVAAFQNVNDLAKFVADNAILQTKIHTIEWAGGTWYLFYFV